MCGALSFYCCLLAQVHATEDIPPSHLHVLDKHWEILLVRSIFVFLVVEIVLVELLLERINTTFMHILHS